DPLRRRKTCPKGSLARRAQTSGRASTSGRTNRAEDRLDVNDAGRNRLLQADARNRGERGARKVDAAESSERCRRLGRRAEARVAITTAGRRKPIVETRGHFAQGRWNRQRFRADRNHNRANARTIERPMAGNALESQ